MRTTLVVLEQQKAATLAGLADWSPARLAARPTHDAWSAAQVLDHLVRVEREILETTTRGLDAPPHRRGVRDRLGVALVDWLFRSDRRVRVPRAAPQVLPDRDVDIPAVRQEWADVRERLSGLVEPLTPAQLRGGVFRHPVSGWMNVPEVLRFYWVHTHHHGYQLARLRAATAGL